ncbi:phosphate regulon sensor histidine kinase PhoR [Spirabiliibacterium falconis]|uniref:phosphate regulon sensor histidine kinase PhoR n=1 Tax=Spirabiliibacterium falconis TaxID=572023 RepID=UPI001AAD625F|nr:phosphate regulon sensor histidine kinase PhoR [Spirabiliibacterium falconis]MBE2894851.1 phosphate regulon sensor histidine kinase PhoR [Spirabiliibacterium falconis]
MLINFSIELLLTAVLAFIFQYFAGHFWIWFTCFLMLVLLFHHYNENNLLKWLHKADLNKKHYMGIWDTLSQTIAYQKRRTRKERIKTLRILSRLNKHIKFLPDGVIICQHNGTILWCNIAAQELFGFYWHKKVHKNIFNVIFYPEFKAYVENTQHSAPLILMPNNEQYIEISKGDYDEALTIFIARDITQMIKLLHARQLFLANFNHELRTPLTVLQGYLELLQDNNIAPEVHQRTIDIMRQQVARMESLLNQLTLLVKIETSANHEHQSAVNVSEIVRQVQKEAQVLSQNTLAISTVLDDDLWIKGNHVEITNLISNLIFNAVKHAHATQLNIKWQRSEKGAYFAVQDNGIGIAKHHIPHLTERFYRIDEGRTAQGSGIGLAIAKHVLIHLNSQLHIESAVGEGSLFSFTVDDEFLLPPPH